MQPRCCRYCLIMTSADPTPGFSLSYELQPGDFAEFQAAANPIIRRRRAAFLQLLVAYVLLGAAFIAVTTIIGNRSGGQPGFVVCPPSTTHAFVEGSSGVSRWLLVLNSAIGFGAIGCGVAFFARNSWRLMPKQLVLNAWQANPRLHGRHHGQIDSQGVVSTVANGVKTFVPWSSLVGVRETEHAFNLLDHHGVLVSLPKRGLHSADLIPALREFLNHSVSGQPPAAT